MKTASTGGLNKGTVKQDKKAAFKEKLDAYIIELAETAAPSMFMVNGSYVPPKGTTRIQSGSKK